MRRQLIPALRMLLVMTVLVGLGYPLAMTALAQVILPDEADGSLVEVDGEPVGSALVGQDLTGDEWFHSRPSASSSELSGSSNLGPTNPDLVAAVVERADAYREENGLPGTAEVPIDAVTTSGSGVDPHISIANARLQAPRVADARGADLEVVLDLVDAHTTGRQLGILGEPGVNVLAVNVALDEMEP